MACCLFDVLTQIDSQGKTDALKLQTIAHDKLACLHGFWQRHDAGISVGLPGTSAMKLKPDGGMVLSLGGVIASF